MQLAIQKATHHHRHRHHQHQQQQHQPQHLHYHVVLTITPPNHKFSIIFTMVRRKQLTTTGIASGLTNLPSLPRARPRRKSSLTSTPPPSQKKPYPTKRIQQQQQQQQQVRHTKEESIDLVRGLREKAKRYEKLGMISSAVFLWDKVLGISCCKEDVLSCARYV